MLSFTNILARLYALYIEQVKFYITLYKFYISLSYNFSMKTIKFLVTTLLLMILCTASFAQVLPITGVMTVCVGVSTTMGDATSGGTWSSSDTTVAKVDTLGSVIGVNAGTATITYSAGSYVTAVITVNPLPLAISGPGILCAGSTMTMTDPSAGGSWSSSNTAIATVSGGLVTGLAAGSTTISYSLSYGCSVAQSITVNPLPAPIAGGTYICSGASSLLTEVTPGGTWSSGTASLTVGSATGIVTAISIGSGMITYTLTTGCYNTFPVSVLSAPGITTGPPAICTGASGIYSNAVAGGIWSCSPASVATIGATSGTLSGFTAGTATVTYTLGTGCSVNKTVTVNPLPAPVSGATGLCPGGIITLSDATPGGTWTSNNTSVAAAGAATGIITGLAPGTTLIQYTSTSGCTSGKTVTVNPGISPITGASAVCSGSTITLSDPNGGGTWSSSNPLVATIGSSSGIVSGGITTGTATIYYSLGAGCTATTTVIVNSSPVAYALTGGGAYCAGSAGTNIGLSGTEAGNEYQLYHSGTPTGTPVSGSGSAISFGPKTSLGAYTVTASNMAGCTKNMTGTATVTMNTLPGTYTVSGGGTFCGGSAGSMIALSGSETGISYQLYNGSSMTGTAFSGTGSTINFGYHSVSGTYGIIATSFATGCTATMSGSAVITINPQPTPFAVTGGGGYCSGGTGVHVGLAGSESGKEYVLYCNGAATMFHLYGTGTVLDFGLQITTGSYTITAIDAVTGCTSNMTGSVTISINPLPEVWTVTASSTGYCSGGSGVHINLSLSGAGIAYQLYRGTTAVGAPLSGSGSALDFGLQTTPGSYTVSAANTVTGCISEMAGIANVNVYPLPVVFHVTGGGSYCGGGTGVHIGTDGSSAGIIYQLYNGGLAAGPGVMGTGTDLDFGLLTAEGVYTVNASNPGTACSADMALSATIAITPPVVPSVSMSIAPGDTVCAGTAVNYTATPVNGGSLPAYHWAVNGAATGGAVSTFSYTPADGDIVSVTMTSSAACAMPASTATSTAMHVITTPAVTGLSALCVGSSTILSDTLVGGIWNSSDPAIAIISTVGGFTGVVTAISAGTVNMTYTTDMGCYSFMTVTVDAVPVATATASGTACGGDYTLTAAGGSLISWLPTSGLGCDTCAITTANPAATTTYTVTVSGPGGCSDTSSVTVNGNRISGYISYTGAASDTFKVWLIQFNSTDSSILALDSVFACRNGGIPYYEFDGKAAGNYMVKAKLEGQVTGTSGYIPTYSLSTPYWYNAASVAHVAGTDTLHINMVYGTVPPGPGFISGLISNGAGRGTSATSPSKGMLVYLVDAVSNFVLTSTYTDDSGNYAFSNIAWGNYLIYPEDFSFTTIPSSVIMLNSTADSANGVNFRQYNDSRVITPITPEGVKNVAAITVNSVILYPNPASGTENIVWGPDASGTAIIVLADMTGRVVYTSSEDLAAIRPSNPKQIKSQIDLSGINPGIYVLTIKSENINYCGKLMIK